MESIKEEEFESKIGTEVKDFSKDDGKVMSATGSSLRTQRDIRDRAIENWLDEDVMEWLNIADGDTVTLHFDPEKIELQERSFNGSPPRTMAVYVVRNAEDNKLYRKSFARMWAKEIQALLNQHHRKIQVDRIGSELETKYYFKALD